MATAVELPEAVMNEIFARTGGKCECTKAHTNSSFAPHHGAKCPRGFFRYGPYFNAIPKGSVHDDKPENYVGVCIECLKLED